MTTTVHDAAVAQFLADVGLALRRLARAIDPTLANVPPRPTAPDPPESPTAPRIAAGAVDTDGPVGTSTGMTAPVEVISTPPPAQPHNPGSSVDTPPAGAPTPDPPEPRHGHLCPDCGRRFDTTHALGVHQARKHGNYSTSADAMRLRQGPKPPPDPCPHCGFQATRHTGAAAHARACNGADKVAANTARMARYRAGERYPLDCPRCGNVAKNGTGAAAHARHCKAPDPDAEALEAEDLATIGVITPDHELNEVAGGFDDTPPLDDTWTGDQVAAELASSEVENPVLPRRPTSEDLDPLDPGRVVYVCPDCDAERDTLFDANFHRRQHRHGMPVKETRRSRHG